MMHVPVLSEVLEVAANFAHWTALWLLAVLFGRGGEADGERDRVLTVRLSAPQTTVVILRSGQGADHVVVSVSAAAIGGGRRERGGR